MTSEHKSDSVNSVFSLRKKPMNEGLKPMETAREQRKVNGGPSPRRRFQH